MVVGLETANRKVANVETHVQRLEKENKDLNQGTLLFIRFTFFCLFTFVCFCCGFYSLFNGPQ